MTKSLGRKIPYGIIFGLLTIVMLAGVLLKPISRYFFPVKYIDIIKKYSSEYNLDEYLIMAVIRTESKFKEDAVSLKNAKGLMQIKEDTAKWCIEKFGIYSDGDIMDPETNIRIGCAYLKYLTDKFGKIEIALAAYNAGEGNVTKWLDGKEALNKEDIPFDETKQYVDMVIKREKIYRFLY